MHVGHQIHICCKEQLEITDRVAIGELNGCLEKRATSITNDRTPSSSAQCSGRVGYERNGKIRVLFILEAYANNLQKLSIKDGIPG